MKKILFASFSLLLIAVFSLPAIAQDGESTLTENDRLQIAIQKICPVSGQALGSAGDPVGITVEGESVFVCCENCVEGEPNAEHMATIHARRAEAQGTCPLMTDKVINAESASQLVDGQRVFVCCKRCMAGLSSRGEAAVATVNENYKNFLMEETQLHHAMVLMAAQKVCPVSGHALTQPEEGEFAWVEHEGEKLLICCSDCAGGEVNDEHLATIHANFAAVQGNCPLMTDKPVTGESASVVHNGRRIFVCCDRCAAGMESGPAEALAIVREKYEANFAEMNK